MPISWLKLINLSDRELARLDFAEMHLACADSLPETADLDINACLRKVDYFAEKVQKHLPSVAHQFRNRPEDFNRSWAYFRVMDMITVLQRDLEVCYDYQLNAASDAVFFRKAEHLFIFGILKGRGGTCTSLPPLYVAVGRRCGYPLKLVTCAQHLFARWDGQGQRFNIECTTHGLVSEPDDHYRSWPQPMSDEQIARNGALQSLTPRQELAHFLISRGHCLLENGYVRFAVGAYAQACNLNPENYGHSSCLVDAMNRWDRQLHARLMPGFPGLTVCPPPRLYPSLPLTVEQAILHMLTKEKLLDDPKLKAEYWEPLRRTGRFSPSRPLGHIEARYTNCGTFDIILLKTPPPVLPGQVTRRC